MSPMYSRNPDVVFRKIADEFILVPIRQKAVDLKSVFTLNETGAFIWEQLDGVTSLDQINERVVRDFDADAAAAAGDVLEIVSHLEALGLVHKA